MPYNAEYYKYLNSVSNIEERLTHHKKLIEWIESNASSINSILEVGCGDGYFVRWLKEKYPEKKIVGVDIHDFRPEGFEYFYVDFTSTQAVRELKEKVGSFDFAFSLVVLEHIMDPYQFVKNISLVLNDNGIVFFEAPNAKTLLLPDSLNFYNDYTHVRPFTTVSMKRLMTDTGLTIEHLSNGIPLIKRILGIPFDIVRAVFLRKNYYWIRIVERLVNADHIKVFARKKI